MSKQASCTAKSSDAEELACFCTQDFFNTFHELGDHSQGSRGEVPMLTGRQMQE